MTRKKVLKHVPESEVGKYKEKERRNIFGLHPVNVYNHSLNEKIVLGRNFIIDGHHRLKELIDKGAPIEVEIYEEILINDYDKLYGYLVGIENCDEVIYYHLSSENTRIYHLYDEVNDTLYRVYIPYVCSNEAFFRSINFVQEKLKLKCFFKDIALVVDKDNYGDASVTTQIVAKGCVNYDGERIIINGKAKHTLYEYYGETIKEKFYSLKDASIDETKEILKLPNEDEVYLICYLDQNLGQV